MVWQDTLEHLLATVDMIDLHRTFPDREGDNVQPGRLSEDPGVPQLTAHRPGAAGAGGTAAARRGTGAPTMPRLHRDP